MYINKCQHWYFILHFQALPVWLDRNSRFSKQYCHGKAPVAVTSCCKLIHHASPPPRGPSTPPNSSCHWNVPWLCHSWDSSSMIWICVVYFVQCSYLCFYCEVDNGYTRLFRLFLIALPHFIQTYGGDTWPVRFYRIYYNARTSLEEMWQGNPVLTAVLFGLPLGFLSLICYSIWCSDIMDADEEEGKLQKRLSFSLYKDCILERVCI